MNSHCSSFCRRGRCSFITKFCPSPPPPPRALALEAPLATALDAVGVQRFSAALASHSWLVLRAAPPFCQLYAHFAQGVIEAGGHDSARRRQRREVSMRSGARTGAIVRVAEVLADAAVRANAARDEGAVALTLRLRWQFERYRAPRRNGARSSPSRRAGKRKSPGRVLDAVRSEAPELLDVVDFNGFWLTPREA